MTVYALTYEVGISSGHEKLIGVYSTIEKAGEIKQKDIKCNGNMEWHYHITPIEIDKTVNKTIREW